MTYGGFYNVPGQGSLQQTSEREILWGGMDYQIRVLKMNTVYASTLVDAGSTPTTLVRAGNLLAEAARIPGMSGTTSMQPDFTQVARRIRDEATDDWNDQVAVDRFTSKGGVLVRGRGELIGPDTVRVADEEIHATKGIVIGTGTSAAIPPIEGLAGTPYWTNREAISASVAPESLVVMGGGAIGCELAQAFARFGTKVTVIEASDRLLPMEVPQAGQLVSEVFAAGGINVATGTSVTSVQFIDGVFHVATGSGVTVAEKLLVATGRRAKLADLGLGSVGLDPDARFIPVDGQMRAGAGLWAVGDVTGKGAFTHIATYQAGIATANILGSPIADADYRALPRVTFTDPEIGSVGMTPDAARDSGLRVRVGSTKVADSTRGWLHGPGNEGFIELVEDADAGVLVGATSAGPVGGEVLSMLTLAVHARVPVAELRTMIYAYPTFHRGVQEALRALAAA